MKLRAMFAIAAILIAGCGSENGAESDTTDGGAPTTTTPPNSGAGGNGPGNGGGGGAGATDNDAGSTGGGDLDSGSTGDQDGGSTGDQDGGTGGGDVDGGTGDQDSGTGTGGDGGSGGGDQDGGTGGGDQDGGVTTDGGSGGGDQDGGSGGGQDSGSGGGDQDSGDTCHAHSCVYTQGYYKNHTGSVTGLTLGGVSYSASEVLGFLNATPNGDDSLILAKQLIAALLNNGQCDPNASATVQAAQDWLAANKDQDGRLPYGTMCAVQSDTGCTAWSLGQTLDQYNLGNSGTPHCQ
jgi:hypothetical protein